jgi:ribosomal protein L23
MSVSTRSSKVFFPNFVLKLVRSIVHFNIGNLPPNQAVFHCPPQLNKLDIKQFLEKVYEIGVKDVRTMNYLGKKGTIIRGRKQGHLR